MNINGTNIFCFYYFIKKCESSLSCEVLGFSFSLPQQLKHDLMGHPSRSIEDSATKSHVDCDRPAQEISEEKNISKWLTDHFSDASDFPF